MWRTTGQENRLRTSKSAQVIGDRDLHQIFTLQDDVCFIDVAKADGETTQDRSN